MPSLPWRGLRVARGPCCFPAWHGGAGGNWHVSRGVTAPHAPLCSGGRWGAWGWAVARTWVRAQLLLSEPRARCWGSWDVCQVLDPGSPRGTAEHPSPSSCVLRSLGHGPARAAGGCGPEPPWLSTQPLCLPLHLPGAGFSPWRFPPGQQPLQPGTLLSGWLHPRCAFSLQTAPSHLLCGAEALTTLVGGCWGLPEMGKGLGGNGREQQTPEFVRPVGLCLCSNIIDVSAADSQGMEQHEYMDRARQYRWDPPCAPGMLAAPQSRIPGRPRGCGLGRCSALLLPSAPLAACSGGRPHTRGSCVPPGRMAGGWMRSLPPGGCRCWGGGAGSSLTLRLRE